MNRLSRPVAQRRVKPELRNLDQRLNVSRRRRHRHPMHLGGRPDAQPLALGPQPAGHRNMKAVQLHPRVKMPFQLRHNPRPQHRLSTVQRDRDHHAEHHKQRQQQAQYPLQAPVPVPERTLHPAHAHPQSANHLPVNHSRSPRPLLIPKLSTLAWPRGPHFLIPIPRPAAFPIF